MARRLASNGSSRGRRAERPLADRQTAAERLAAEDRLRGAIDAAWEHARYPGDEQIDGCRCGRDECVLVAGYFTGRAWQDVSFGELRKALGAAWDVPMHFLTPAAFAFFLPAFLLMVLDEQERLDVLGDGIVNSLCPHEGWRDRVRPLTVAQQRVVLSLLQLVRQRRPAPSVAIDRGIRFWSDQVAREER